MGNVSAIAVMPGSSPPSTVWAIKRFTRWSILWTLLSAGAVLGVVAALATVAAPAPQGAQAASLGEATPAEIPYPYATATRIGPWGFYTRHSTDYVAWRFFERDVAFSADMMGPSGKTGHFGDPGTWAANAAVIGFKVDGAPRAGSIAHWGGGEQGASSAGHVAYVDRVNADGSVVISEFDWSVKYGYSQRGQAGTTSVRAPRYIHIQDA